MTNTFTVHLRSNLPSDPLRYDINTKSLREHILGKLFRTKPILKDTNSLKIKESISPKVLQSIAQGEIITESLANAIIARSLSQLRRFSRFMGIYAITWGHTPAAHYRKARIYLHKIHKIAPVFNYQRATFNLHSLQTFFRRASIWPHLSTQLALTIYITNRNAHPSNPILPSNVRALSHCSAYAFYKNRTMLLKKGVLTEYE